MRKQILLIVLACAVFALNAAADVTLRFWDDGVLIHTATETENAGTRTISTYYSSTPASCDGYTFVGWKVSSPIVNETIYANDAASGITSTVTIGTSDIDLYAVYKKSVTCYKKTGALSDLTNGGKYLIVGYNSGNTSYYAMSNENLGSNSSAYSGVTTSQVTPCGSTIYTVDATCVWNLSGNSNGNYYYQNNSSGSLYIRYYYNNNPAYYEYLIRSGYATYLNFSVADSVWTIKTIESYTRGNRTYYYWYLLNFAVANNLGDLSSYSNIFTAGRYDTRVSTYYNNPTTAGSIYLYKQGTENRYKSKCSAYTLQFRACGDNSCGSAVSVSPTSLTEMQTATNCVGLAQFSGVNPTSVTPTIDCPSIWTFAGWATEPCADQSQAAPTYITANPYALYHQNDVLYAVYRHYTNGVADYWSSYPLCNPFQVTFDPCNGKVNGSSTPDVETESSIGAGVTTPVATFTTCSGWNFAGWATTACVGADAAPSGMIAASTTYHPAADGERFYAVYTNGSRWTSYPICEAGKVTLNAVTGKVDGATTKVLTEASVGAGVTLIAATTECSSIWGFAGWSNSVVTTTSTAPSVYASGATYHPISANDQLYAVYVRGTAPNQVWTSSPSCSAYNVIVYACGSSDCENSSVNGKSWDTVNEGAIGSGITFPAAVTSCGGRWTFAGWNQGSPIEHKYTLPAGLYASGATYIPTQDNETFYAVYKHADMDYWTSNPDCALYTVHLHACEGTIGTSSAVNVDSTEVSAGNGILLPSVAPLCTTRGWVFHGWVEGGDLATTQDIAGLTVYSAGTRYKPIRDNVHLYAVFSVSGYKQVTSYDELNTTDEYVIAFYWNYGNAYHFENFALSNQAHETYTAALNLVPIEAYTDAEGNKYVAAPANNCKWKLLSDGAGGWGFRSVANNYYVYSYQDYAYLTTNNNNATAFTINLEENCIGRKTYSDDYRYWYFLNENMTTFYAFQSDSPDKCYLYHITGTVYSSWPHCAEYTVNFDGCDGLAASASETEEDAGKGVTVPDVSQVCSGWTFAGWATSPYEDKTGTLTRNLYPAGTTYVPDKNNVTLYAVYYQTKDTFELLSGISDMYAGVNYVIVYNGTKAMNNTVVSASGGCITVAAVTPNAGKIINPANAIRWRLMGYEGNYIWYNPSVNKYLDLTFVDDESYYEAYLQSTPVDNFSISYVDDSYFLIRSNNNQSTLRYGDTWGDYFTCFTYTSSSDTKIKLYRQKADYWSYPCSVPVEPVKWGNGTVTVESLTLSGAPTSGSAVISSIAEGDDNTYVITHTAKPGHRMRINWGGTYYQLTVPYIASPTYTPGVENMPKNDLVILPNAQFTVNVKTRLHTVSVYDDASLIIAEGDTLFVDTLYLRSEGTDNHPNIVYGGNTSAIVVNSGIIYHDRRLDYYDYYPFGIPFDANSSDVRYAGLIANTATPVLNTNYWIKYYNGPARAAAATTGEYAETYWTVLDNNSTISGGIGYSIGILDNDIGNHNKRTLRFPMSPIANWNKYEDGTNNRAITITPSKVNDATLKQHSGWNFVSNPYLHTYYPGNPDASSHLLTGHFDWVDGKWTIVQDETQVIPYLTFYDVNSHDYYQTTAASSNIRPFSTAFVQVEDYNQLLFSNPIEAPSSIVAHTREAEETRIVRTGLLLRDNQELRREGHAFNFDETGLIISNRYTNEYEVGADLVKWQNPNLLHVYTLNDNYQLAFNALDEQTAAQPIKVGVSVAQTGSYTFCFDDRQYDPDVLEALYLTDYKENNTTNLLESDYTCTIEKGVNESRFVLNAILRKQEETPSNIEATAVNGLQVLTNQDGSITIYSHSQLTSLTVYDIAGRLLGEWRPNDHQWTISLPQGVYAVSVKDNNNLTTHIKVCTR